MGSLSGASGPLNPPGSLLAFRPLPQFSRGLKSSPLELQSRTAAPPSPGADKPGTAVYQANQHIMMVNHLPMPYPMPQGPQYCIPQYRHSGPPYVGPPQQYPVQPPGPGPFYPGPGPGEFPNAYGAPFYPSQPVYPSAPIIVPTPQQQPLPPTKREKKTIRIRDRIKGQRHNGRNMSAEGAGTPRLLLSAHLNPSPPPEEKPKTDPVLKSPSPALRPEPSGERKEQAGLAVETPPCPETSLEPPGPAGAPSLAVVPPSRSPLAPGSQDGCELASPPQEAPPPLPRAGPCLELPSCPLEEEADPERCREEPSRIVPNDLHQTPSANLINELNGVPKECSSVTASRTSAEAKEAVLPALELAVKNGGGIARPASWLFPAPLTPPRPPHSPLALPVAPPPSCPVSSPLAFPPLRGQCCSAHPPGDLDREGPPTDSEDPPNAKEEVEMDGREKKKKKRTWKGDFRAQCQDRPGR
ncbi:putative Eukaryotic translation initiation factor 4 gamma 3 protein, partial [Naja naja]